MTTDEQALETLKADIKAAIDKYNKVASDDKQLEYFEEMEDIKISVEETIKLNKLK